MTPDRVMPVIQNSCSATVLASERSCDRAVRTALRRGDLGAELPLFGLTIRTGALKVHLRILLNKTRRNIVLGRLIVN